LRYQVLAKAVGISSSVSRTLLNSIVKNISVMQHAQTLVASMRQRLTVGPL